MGRRARNVDVVWFRFYIVRCVNRGIMYISRKLLLKLHAVLLDIDSNLGNHVWAFGWMHNKDPAFEIGEVKC